MTKSKSKYKKKKPLLYSIALRVTKDQYEIITQDGNYSTFIRNLIDNWRYKDTFDDGTT